MADLNTDQLSLSFYIFLWVKSERIWLTFWLALYWKKESMFSSKKKNSPFLLRTHARLRNYKHSRNLRKFLIASPLFISSCFYPVCKMSRQNLNGKIELESFSKIKSIRIWSKDCASSKSLEPYSIQDIFQPKLFSNGSNVMKNRVHALSRLLQWSWL